MARVLKRTSFGLMIVSIFIFCYGFLDARGVRGRRAADALYVDPSTKSFGEARAGTELVMTFTLGNRGMRELHILGADATCYQAVCLEAKGLPLTIPPGEDRSLEIKILARNPGGFSRVITIFTDCVGQTEVALGVEGRVIEAVVGE